MKKSITDVNVQGKRCLVRADFNVPLDENKNITDDNRITATLPTIKYLLSHGAKVILMSHLGRPKGQINPKYSLAPVAKKLSELLGREVLMAKDVVGESADKLVKEVKDGQAVLLENLRFCPEEEANDSDFSKKLASYCDIYVNDAFGTAHRAHASTAGVAKFCKTNVCGFLIQKELDIMGKALENPVRPFVAILGGSKVSDKIGVIKNLIDKCDSLLIGGGMAYTFFKALGYNIGTSICENDKLDLAKELVEKAKSKGVEMLLPVDNVVADAFSNDANFKTVKSSEIPDGWMGMDIGEKTIENYQKIIAHAGTIVWNGPVGVFEMSNYSRGTFAIAKAIADSKAVSIIGGGDSASAVNNMGFADKVTHISTGGGASLEYLEGLVLPGIDCLDEK